MAPQRGLHLLELTLVVAILGIVAVVALPHLAASDPIRLDLAAQEVADAVRYARAEAVRTGQVHGVQVDYDNGDASHKEITVYRVDTAASPFGFAALLHHPVDKQTYDRQVSEGPRTRGVTIRNASHPFTYVGLAGAQRSVHFDVQGTPMLMSDGSRYRLAVGNVLLGNGRDQRTVSVDTVTGRVSVQ